MLRIGIDVRTVGKKRTGSETYILQLVKGLSKIDKKNRYFLYTNTKNKKIIKEIKNKLGKLSENFQLISVLPASKSVWTFFSLPIRARKDNLDILHVEYIAPFLTWNNFKIITTIHDVSFERYPEFINYKDLFFLKKLIPLSIKRAKKVIAVSDFTKKEIENFYKTRSQKVLTIYNGGASESLKLSVDEEELKEFKNKKDLNEPYVLSLGTLQPRKNIPFLIKSFERFMVEVGNKSDKFSKLKLIIGGSKLGHNYDEKVDLEIGRLLKENPMIAEKIKFEGFIKDEDLPFYYQGAEAFIFASIYEGFGLPGIEAMASGLPVLASNSSCFLEIFGEGAFYFKENSEKDFVTSLKKVLFDDKFKVTLIKSGKKQAKAFDWVETAKQTLSVYESV